MKVRITVLMGFIFLIQNSLLANETVLLGKLRVISIKEQQLDEDGFLSPNGELFKLIIAQDRKSKRQYQIPFPASISISNIKMYIGRKTRSYKINEAKLKILAALDYNSQIKAVDRGQALPFEELSEERQKELIESYKEHAQNIIPIEAENILFPVKRVIRERNCE